MDEKPDEPATLRNIMKNLKEEYKTFKWMHHDFDDVRSTS